MTICRKQRRIRKSVLFRRRTGQGGQVLAFALVALISILVGAILIFDIHVILRGKVKGQNAVDAAAMTGAKWQQHALNLIGELNLIKATTLLVSDSVFGTVSQDGTEYEFTHVRPPEDYMSDGVFNAELMKKDIEKVEEERQKIVSAVDLLTQMQTRVSFVLPIVGYGAAQQAAKNNGITANHDGGEFLHDFYNEIMDDALYGNPDIAPVLINDYAWRQPYSEMIQSLLMQENDTYTGVAAGTCIDRLTTPYLFADPPNGMLNYLTSKWFYRAILANSWCELKDLLLNGNFPGRWWGSFTTKGGNGAFIGESEILPLHVEFFTGAAPLANARINEVFPNRFGELGNTVPLTEIMDYADPYLYTYDEETNVITLAVSLDENGRPVRNSADTDYLYNYLPDFKWCVYGTEWYSYSENVIDNWGVYLRGKFKEGYEYYSGALSWFTISQPTETWMGYVFNSAGDSGFNFKNKQPKNAMRTAQENLRDGVHDIETDALAKPFGRVKIENKYEPPFKTGNMILPVFTDVALIPVSLEPVYGLNQIDRDWIIFLTKYLPLLGTTNSLSDMESAIHRKELEDSQKYGEAKNYWSSCLDYHRALEKFSDPAWRQRGIDWLNTPIAYDKVTKQPSRYNKDACRDWPSGGSGERVGPGSIH